MAICGSPNCRTAKKSYCSCRCGGENHGNTRGLSRDYSYTASFFSSSSQQNTTIEVVKAIKHENQFDINETAKQLITSPTFRTIAIGAAEVATAIFAPPFLPLVHGTITTINYFDTAYKIADSYAKWRTGENNFTATIEELSATGSDALTSGYTDRSSAIIANQLKQVTASESSRCPIATNLGYTFIVKPVISSVLSSSVDSLASYAVYQVASIFES